MVSKRMGNLSNDHFNAEEADCSGVVNGEGVRGGMLLARREWQHPPQAEGEAR